MPESKREGIKMHETCSSATSKPAIGTASMAHPHHSLYACAAFVYMFNLSVNGVVEVEHTMKLCDHNVCVERGCCTLSAYHQCVSMRFNQHLNSGFGEIVWRAVYFAILHQRVSRCFWTMRIFVLLCRRAWLGKAFHLILFNQQKLGRLMRSRVRCIKTLVYPSCFSSLVVLLVVHLSPLCVFPSLFHHQTPTDAHTYVSSCLTSNVWAQLPSVPHSQRPVADSQHFLI